MRVKKGDSNQKPDQCFDVLLFQGTGKWSHKVAKFVAYELATNYGYQIFCQKTGRKRPRVGRNSLTRKLCRACIIILSKKVSEDTLYLNLEKHLLHNQNSRLVFIVSRLRSRSSVVQEIEQNLNSSYSSSYTLILADEKYHSLQIRHSREFLRGILIASGLETEFSYSLKSYTRNKTTNNCIVFHTIKEHEKYLEPGTRGWLFEEAHALLKTNRIVSVIGHPGVGKTTFAAALCSNLLKLDKLGAAHFISHRNVNSLHVCGKYMMCSLASQLCRNIPEFSAILTETNRGNSLESLLSPKLSLSQIFEYLVVEPLSRKSDHEKNNIDDGERMKVIILDGFELCKDKHELLRLFASLDEKVDTAIKILIISEPSFQERLRGFPQLLLTPTDPRNMSDIRLYLKNKLSVLLPTYEIEEGIEYMVDYSRGMFSLVEFLRTICHGNNPQQENDGVVLTYQKQTLDLLSLKALNHQNTYAKSVDYLRRLEQILGDNIRHILSPFLATLSSEPIPLEYWDKHCKTFRFPRNDITSMLYVDEKLNRVSFIHPAFPESYFVHKEQLATGMKKEGQKMLFELCWHNYESPSTSRHLFSADSQVRKDSLAYLKQFSLRNVLVQACYNDNTHAVRALVFQFDWLCKFLQVCRPEDIENAIQGLRHYCLHNPCQTEVKQVFTIFTLAIPALLKDWRQVASQLLARLKPPHPLVKQAHNYLSDLKIPLIRPIKVEVEKGDSRCEQILTGHESAVTHASISSDGKSIISISSDQSVNLWSVFNGDRVQKLKSNPDCNTFDVDSHSSSISFINSSSLFVLGISIEPCPKRAGYVSVWTTKSCTHVIDLKGINIPVDAIVELKVSASGNYIAAYCRNAYFFLWAAVAPEFKCEVEFSTRLNLADSFGISEDASIIAFGINGQVFVYKRDCGDLTALYTLKPLSKLHVDEPSTVIDIAFRTSTLSNKLELISSFADERLWVWDMSNGKIMKDYCSEGMIDREPILIRFRRSSKKTIALSYDKKLIAVGNLNNQIEILEAENMQLLEKLDGHVDEIDHLEFFPNEHRLVSSSKDKQIRIWSLSGVLHDCLIELERTSGYIESKSTSSEICCFDYSEEVLVTGNTDGSVMVWSLQSGLRLHRMLFHTSTITSIKLVNSRMISASDDGDIVLWDFRNVDIAPKARKLIFTTSDGLYRFITLKESNEFMFCSADKVILKSCNEGATRSEYVGDRFNCFSAVAQSNHHIFAINDNDEVFRWRKSSLKLNGLADPEIFTIDSGNSCIALQPSIFAVTSESRKLAIGSYENSIVIVDASTDSCSLFNILHHLKNDPYTCIRPLYVSLTFCDNNTMLISRQVDGVQRIWRVDDGTPVDSSIISHIPFEQGELVRLQNKDRHILLDFEDLVAVDTVGFSLDTTRIDHTERIFLKSLSTIVAIEGIKLHLFRIENY